MAQRAFKVEGISVTKLPSTFATDVTVSGNTTLNDTTIAATKTLSGKVSLTTDSVKATTVTGATGTTLVNRDEAAAIAAAAKTFTGQQLVNTSGGVHVNGTGSISFQKDASQMHVLYPDDVNGGRLLIGFPGAATPDITVFNKGSVTSKIFKSDNTLNTGAFNTVMHTGYFQPFKVSALNVVGPSFSPIIALNYDHKSATGTNAWGGTYSMVVENTGDASGSNAGRLLLAHMNNAGTEKFAVAISPEAKAFRTLDYTSAPTITGTKIETGMVLADDGRIQVKQNLNSASGAAMLEFHIPGKHAKAWTLQQSGDLDLLSTNGAGVGSTSLVKLAGRGRVISYAAAEGPSGTSSETPFWVEQLTSTSTTTYTPFVGGRVITSGVYDNKVTFGAYNSTAGWTSCGAQIVTNDSNGNDGYGRAWQFMNNGHFISGHLSSGKSGGAPWSIHTGDIFAARYTGGSIITWVQSGVPALSDRRFKENIKKTTKTALDKVEKFNFVEYDWKVDDKLPKSGQNVKLGLVAQEVEVIDADCAGLTHDALRDEPTHGLDTQALLMLALKAIQELTARVKELENK